MAATRTRAVGDEDARDAPLPRITLITPSYQQATFLEATIRSVVDQRYPDLEYFVYDGGSTDGSVDIIRAHAADIDYWRSAPDEGQAAAINAGWERATGDILGWLNSDDQLAPGALLRVGRLFAAHPEFTGSTLSALHYEVNDVAYMAFYAMAAVGSAPLTGPNIAQALANGKLNPPGTPIDAEPSQFGKAFGILAQGGSIDINGLFGPEDFNTKTGASNGLAEIQCVNSTFKVASSGYSWDDASKASVGSVSNCN